MTLRILVVDNNPAEVNVSSGRWYTGGLGPSFVDEMQAVAPEAEIDLIAPYDGPVAVDYAAYDGVAFSGSAVAWNTSDTRAAPLARVMEDAFAAGTPVYGSCNGMQLAASVLGGVVGESPNGREDGLALDVMLTEARAAHRMMAGRASGFAAPCVHRDEVTRLPDGAVLLAGNAHSPVQAFSYEQGDVRFWGCQYHPEYAVEAVMACLRDTDRAAAADAMAAELARDGADLQPDVRRTELRNWVRALTPS